MKPKIENTSVEDDDEGRVAKSGSDVASECEGEGGGGGDSGGSGATSNGSNATSNKPYERKRTANLENLIGNLKVIT